MKGKRPEIRPALRTKLAWCSWSVQFSFLLQSGCDVLDVAGPLCCQPTGCRHRKLGHLHDAGAFINLSSVSAPFVTWVDKLTTHPSWLSLLLISSEWNSYGIPESWLSYYPPFVEITLALRAVKLVVSEPLNYVCNSSWSRCFLVWMHINHSDLEDRMMCLQQPLYRLY